MINLDEEFAAAEDSDYEDEGEDEKSSSPTPVPSTDYPERGLFPTTKEFLIQQLDKEGGIDCFTRENRLLESICNQHPDKLGTEDSELRKRVRVCAHHWKRNRKLYTNARKKASQVSKPNTRSVSAPPTATLPPVHSHSAAIVSPPAIVKRASTASMFSPNRKKSAFHIVLSASPIDLLTCCRCRYHFF